MPLEVSDDEIRDLISRHAERLSKATPVWKEVTCSQAPQAVPQAMGQTPYRIDRRASGGRRLTMAAKSKALAKAKARIALLEAQLQDREAAEHYLRTQVHQANRLREEERRRRLDLENEFNLMGYRHVTRPAAAKIKKRFEEALRENG